MTGQKPIGWWVKRLDALLEQVLDRALAGDGLTRRHWQVLHSLSSMAMYESRLPAVLEPFGAPVDFGPVVGDLVARGWVTRGDDGRLFHSDVGQAAHRRLFDRVSRLRGAVTEGLSAEEYERTVAALERMAGNVERALAEAES
jgi:DNA-binding MarR family transcriptional regulator